MKEINRILPGTLGLCMAIASTASLANVSGSMSIKNTTGNGSPSFVTGNLGPVAKNGKIKALKNLLLSQPSFGLTGNEGFKVKRKWVDKLGKSHAHFSQTINGLPVYGTSLIMHADENPVNSFMYNATPTDTVYAITGSLAVDAAPSISSMMRSGHDNGKQARSLAKQIGKISEQPELAYVYLPATDETKLAWRMEVSWDHGYGRFGRDFVFYDAYTSELLIREAQVHSSKRRQTYTLNGGGANSAPGRLLCTDNQNCNDAAAQRAHDGASKVYDYYSTKFSRDSLDDNGMTLISSVALGGKPNAYWNGSQMLYGIAQNGNNDYTSDFDVIGHEFTHGVTAKTAGLRYQNASGALNEAWSDILGLSAEAFRKGVTTSSWLLGDGLYNNQPGKALRYMNNPTQDGYSKDYYPERIPFVNYPTQDNDYGGVHGNSGIANLAYVLLVDGGRHPRNKTNVQVPSIGMAKAEQIFYRALTTYMNQNTNFAGARTATVQAAQDLYGATEKNAVETAWCAVGVGTCPVIVNPPTPPTGDNVLQNNVTKSNLSATSGNDIIFTMNVPAGATDVSFVINGGSGDADMYVKFNSSPTDANYDCRPYLGGNSETCNMDKAGGTYYVRIKAYQSFTGLTLTGSYKNGTTKPPGLTPIKDSLSNVYVNAGSWIQYMKEIPAGYSTLKITTSGGTGDLDMYIRLGGPATGNNYDCRPYKNGNNETCTFNAPKAGIWYINLYGYQGASGVTLTLEATP